jgi:hypothetical protein
MQWLLSDRKLRCRWENSNAAASSRFVHQRSTVLIYPKLIYLQNYTVILYNSLLTLEFETLPVVFPSSPRSMLSRSLSRRPRSPESRPALSPSPNNLKLKSSQSQSALSAREPTGPGSRSAGVLLPGPAGNNPPPGNGSPPSRGLERPGHSSRLESGVRSGPVGACAPSRAVRVGVRVGRDAGPWLRST